MPNLKQVLMKHWQLIEQQPLLREMYKDPPSFRTKNGDPAQRYTRTCQTIKRLKQALGSRAGLSTPFYMVYTGSSIVKFMFVTNFRVVHLGQSIGSPFK